MPVDIAFELSYLLSDKLGEDVSVENLSFDPETGRLCIEAVVGDRRGRACIEVRACKGLREEGKWVRCVSKNVVNNEKLLDELVRGLRGG